MDASKENLNGLFQDTVGIPLDKVNYYVGWLNRFLQFYNRGLDDISEDDLGHSARFWKTKDMKPGSMSFPRIICRWIQGPVLSGGII
jgi:small nuclear ribonucleoprotein (snRNP)-like protein